MAGQTNPLVSIIVVTYNSAHYITDCLEALTRQQYAPAEIILVDNASTDETVQVVRECFPQVTLIALDTNAGFGGGNNLGAQHATGEYLAFVNPDTQVDPHWLLPLISTLQNQPDTGIVTAKLLLTAQPDKINTTGNYMHFTGFGYLRGWLEHKDAYTTSGDIFAISGAAFAMQRTLFEQIGGFDELFYPAYVEDIDLSWRVHLTGARCVFVADSVVYHDYTQSFHLSKYTMLEKHRQQMLFKNLRWPTLVVLLPALLLAEVVTWGYAVLSGVPHLRAKWRSYGWFFTQWGELRQARAKTQRLRHVSDRDILKKCTYRLNYGQAGRGLAVTIGEKVIDPIFFVLYHLSLVIIRW